MILNKLLANGKLLQTRYLFQNVKQMNKFSAFKKPTGNNHQTNMKSTDLIKRNLIKIRVFRKEENSNQPLRPFSLLNEEPFILPGNPFSLLFAQLYRGLTIRLEMSRIDPTFNINEFYLGAQMALVTVSNRISQGNFEDLNGLVDPELIEKLKSRYQGLSEEEKSFISIKKEEIANNRIVGFNVYKTNGLYVRMKLLVYLMNMEKMELDQIGSDNVSMDEYFKKQLQNLMMAEYTFVRDYSKKSESSNWLITELNHYNSDYYARHIRDSKS